MSKRKQIQSPPTARQEKTVHPSREPAQLTVSHPAFLAGMQQGEELYQQEHGQDTCLSDLALLEFYQSHLTPFEADPLTSTGMLLSWMCAFLASGLQLDFSAENADFSTGYSIATQDWHIWRKDELLNDVAFAKLLATELAPDTLATMRATEPWYTETYQIGYVFGLVRGLLTSPDIQIVEYPASQ